MNCFGALRPGQLAVGLMFIVIACSPGTPSDSPDALDAREPAPTPPVADVLAYRGDTARTGRMPGPVPAQAPIALWADPHDSLPPGQPIVVHGLVITASPDGVVRAVDATDGSEAWRVRIPAAVRGNPAADGEALYLVTEDGMLRALSTTDGLQRWQLAGFIADGSVAVDNGLVVAPTADGIAGVRIADGAELWRTEVAPSTRIAVGHGRVYAGGDHADEVARLDVRTGTLMTPLSVGGADVLSPAIAGDTMFVAHRDVPGGANGVDAFSEDGTRRWSWMPPGGERIEGIGVSDGLVLVLTEEPAILYAVSRSDGSDAWKRRYDGHSSGGIAIVDDVAVVSGEEGGIVAIDLERGDIRWRAPVANERPSWIVVTGGIVLLLANRGQGAGSQVALVDPLDARMRMVARATPAPTESPAPSGEPLAPGVVGAIVEPIEDAGRVAGLALGPDGTVYMPDIENHRILVRNPDGTTSWWGTHGSGPGAFDFSQVTQGDGSAGVAVSPDGRLIAVGDGGNHRVQLFDADRGYVTTFGRTGRADGQFVNPCCVAVDDQHRVWVVDAGRGDVQVFDERGKHLDTFASEGRGDGQLLRPGSPYVRTDAGQVLVPDFANHRVSVFDTNGTFLRTYTSRPAQDLVLGEVNEVKVDQWGRLFFLDSMSGVRVLSPDGELLATIPLTLPEIGRLDVTGMALDPAGRLYLADTGGNRLVILELGPPLWPGEAPTDSP